jgi:hypothetical protein
MDSVKSLFGDGAEKAHLVVAPYGSGKSLAATFLLQLVENRADAQKALGEIGKRLSLVRSGNAASRKDSCWRCRATPPPWGRH